MLEKIAVHLDEEHSKTVNVDGVCAGKLLGSLMATYDGLTVKLKIDLQDVAVIRMYQSNSPPADGL